MYEYYAQIVKVIDGDTFDCVADLGFGISYKIRVRLGVVDTPERGEPRWSEATEYTRAWFEANPTFILRTLKDSSGGFGRYLGWVYNLDESDNLIDKLLHHGFAKYQR